MPRFAFSVVSFALLFVHFAQAQDRTLVAEGDYSAYREQGEKILAHWKLWQLRTGEYEAIESTTKSAVITQTFRFDAAFMPIGFALKVDALPGELEQHSKVMGDFHPMSISCEYKPQELTCGTEYDGRNSTTSIPAKFPYVFLPGEFYALDFTWFLTAVIHLIEREDVKGNEVNGYTLEDNRTKGNQIDLKADGPIRLTFTGNETAVVMGKTATGRFN